MTGDSALMRQAITAATTVRTTTAPNPWVGAVVLGCDGRTFVGATEPPGGAHAEIVALRAAGSDAAGATLVTTLEPCSHHGRTAPCTDAIIGAGVGRVVIGVVDPDPNVSGAGLDRLRTAGLEVVIGVEAAPVAEQLAPYLHHRRTGRPWVVLKLAATLDARTAAPDGSSQWITGDEARCDAHRLRAESQAIIVGAGTVRSDDPSLTTRLVDGPSPRRVVLGRASPGAKVHPCLEWVGALDGLLDRLGGEGVLQVLVEGGASVAADFHRAALVNRYVVYVAPALFGGDDARPLFTGDGAVSISDLVRGRFVDVQRVGTDLRIEFEYLRGGDQPGSR